MSRIEEVAVTSVKQLAVADKTSGTFPPEAAQPDYTQAKGLPAEGSRI
jgi:hypothetical protein